MRSSQRSFIRSHKGLFILGLLAALLLAMVLGAALGSVQVPLSRVLTAALGRRETTEEKIVALLRFPRVLGAALCGAGFALSGCIIQGVLHNPLAAPNIIGVNSGAGLGVALAAALLPNVYALTPWAALCGAVLACMALLLLSERYGASRTTVILCGLALSALFNGCIDAVLTFVPDALTGYTDFRMGGFRSLMWDRVLWGGILILSGILAALLSAGALDVLLLGTETAQSLGLKAKRARLLFLLLAALLSGAAVSIGGLIGFVGLIVPHCFRRLLGEESLPLLLASAIGGALLLVLCDLLARLIFAPFELPVGICTSLIGAPFFLILILSKRRGKTNGAS